MHEWTRIGIEIEVITINLDTNYAGHYRLQCSNSTQVNVYVYVMVATSSTRTIK